MYTGHSIPQSFWNIYCVPGSEFQLSQNSQVGEGERTCKWTILQGI